MKEPNYTLRGRPAGIFDNTLFSFMVHWMQPFRLKAIRGYTSAGMLLLAVVGCQTDGETVPVKTTGLPINSAPATPEPHVLTVAQVEPSSPAKIDKPAAAADISTNTTPVLTTAEATAKAMAEVGATNPPIPEVTTNATPLIKEEIPPARPANLNISEATEKVIKLTESNLEEQVILTFVQQTATKFDLDADEIVYLSDLGVPSTVIAAMLKHDGDDPTKAENVITGVANTENIQPAIPANTNLPPAIAQTQSLPQPPPGVAQQQIEVTTNYIPNQQVVYQQPPVVVQQPQTVVVEQAPTVVYAQPETVTYFYDSLSPYGSWFYVNDFGWCWQPTVAVVDHGWRPYGPRGRWVWTDAGWYWASDYSWGWAPFHYGRWHMAGARGWIWVPDRTWGPAWVTWRSSGDYCGWAPLPPHAVFTPGIGFTYFGRGVDVSFGFGLGYDAFCFAPFGRFHNRHVYDYCLPRREVVRVFPHSHVENRWEFRDNSRFFVNRAGPRLETGVRPAAIRTMSEGDRSRFGNRERIEHTSRETVIYRPPSPPSNAANNVAGNRPAPGTRGNGQNSNRPPTRAELATRPSSTASGIAAPASQPRTFDPRNRNRSEDRPQATTRPSNVPGGPPPVRTGDAPVIAPPTRADRTAEASRGSTSLPRPSSAPPPVAATPSRTIESPRVGAPAPTPVRPSIGNNVITSPARRPLADASPATTTPLPGSPNFNNSPRSATTAEPAPSRRDAFRNIPQPSTPAPQVATPPTAITPSIQSPSVTVPAPRTITPSIQSPAVTTPTPRTIAPPPQTVAPPPQISSPPPRIISPPISSPAPTRGSPSAPTYSAPSYTPPMRGNSAPGPSAPAPASRAPVYQAPSSRGGEPRQATSPSTVSPDRRGGRRD